MRELKYLLENGEIVNTLQKAKESKQSYKVVYETINEEKFLKEMRRL